MMKVLVSLVLMLMAVSAVQNAAAAEAPAPAPVPVSDASIFVPTVFASLVALVFGMLF